MRLRPTSMAPLDLRSRSRHSRFLAAYHVGFAVLLLVVIAATVVAVRASSSASQSHAAGLPRAAVAPARSMPLLWGVFSGAADDSHVPREVVLAQEQGSLGHKMNVWHWYENWDTSWDGMAADGVDFALSHDLIPMITWEAWNRPLDQIAHGAYDERLSSIAQATAATHQEIWIRLFHEFNDCTNYPWQICRNDAGTFVAAWRHTVLLFRANGAGNVKFVWNPDGAGDLASLKQQYPGDEYVDFSGWDDYGYNSRAAYMQLSYISQRPMVLGEVGVDDSQVSWLRDLSANIEAGTYPLIHALVWFDKDRWAIGGNRQIAGDLRTLLASASYATTR